MKMPRLDIAFLSVALTVLPGCGGSKPLVECEGEDGRSITIQRDEALGSEGVKVDIAFPNGKSVDIWSGGIDLPFAEAQAHAYCEGNNPDHNRIELGLRPPIAYEIN